MGVRPTDGICTREATAAPALHARTKNRDIMWRDTALRRALRPGYSSRSNTYTSMMWTKRRSELVGNITSQYSSHSSHSSHSSSHSGGHDESFFRYFVSRLTGNLARYGMATLKVLAVLAPTAYMVNSYIGTFGVISGRSMKPTLNPDSNGTRRDWVLIQRLGCTTISPDVALDSVASAEDATDRDHVARAVIDPFDGVHIIVPRSNYNNNNNNNNNNNHTADHNVVEKETERLRDSIGRDHVGAIARINAHLLPETSNGSQRKSASTVESYWNSMIDVRKWAVAGGSALWTKLGGNVKSRDDMGRRVRVIIPTRYIPGSRVSNGKIQRRHQSYNPQSEHLPDETKKSKLDTALYPFDFNNQTVSRVRHDMKSGELHGVKGTKSFVDSLSIRPGDIVMLTSPMDPDVTFVKRVLAVGGQYVHPRVLDTEGVPPKLKELNKVRGVNKDTLIEIPRNHIWVESDDPYHGIDSNYFGPASVGLVTGKVLKVIYPLDRYNAQIHVR